MTQSVVQGSPERETAPADRVSLREMIGLGFGQAVSDGTHGTLYVLISPIYNITLGVSPVLISILFLTQRLWDAMLDPLCGQFSDNFRSRWGRRRPLLLVAAIPMAALFTLMWWFPRNASSNYLFGHMLVVSLTFYLAHSLYTMPLGGLIIEATDDYHERTRIAGATLAFGFASQIASQWAFPLTQLAIFHNTVTGVRWVSTGLGVVFLLVALIPVLLCRERLYSSLAVTQPKIELWASLREVQHNRSFMALLWARFIFSFGYNVVGTLSAYMYIYYVFNGDLRASALGLAVTGSCYHIAAVVSSIFFYPVMGRWIGKRRTLQLAGVILVIGCLLKTVLYHRGWVWLPTIIIGINGISAAGMTLMGVAMLGDIADYDEWETGLRREALFTSLLSWFVKAGTSLGSFFTGFILVWIGFNARLGGQSWHTLRLMKLSYIIFPIAAALLTILFAQYYRLSEQRVYDLKAALAQRRAQAAAATGTSPPLTAAEL